MVNEHVKRGSAYFNVLIKTALAFLCADVCLRTVGLGASIAFLPKSYLKFMFRSVKCFMDDLISSLCTWHINSSILSDSERIRGKETNEALHFCTVQQCHPHSESNGVFLWVHV
jgi:hypothetical protein